MESIDVDQHFFNVSRRLWRLLGTTEQVHEHLSLQPVSEFNQDHFNKLHHCISASLPAKKVLSRPITVLEVGGARQAT